MSDKPSGWRALEPPRRPKADEGPKPTPAFTRLARVQVLSAAGDAMIAVALAGSLFFSIDPSAARSRVGLYLALTVAPFAVVGPLIGPMLDRAKSGRRIMITMVNLGRAVTALLMISNVDSLLLFPLAFAILVGAKSYAVGKAAVVPTVVRDQAELVSANSRLSLLTGLAGIAGAAPAALASLIAGPSGAVALAMFTFAGATVASLQLPSVAVAAAPADSTEKLELRSIGIRLAGSAMGILRGIVGYLTFLIAFAFRGGADGVDLTGIGSAIGTAAHERLGFDVGGDSGVPAWQLGAVLAFNVVGMLGGAVIAPRLRRSTPEENILLGVLVLLAGVALFGAWTGDLTAAALVAMTVGFAASAGKLSFDSIVQRDAPDANYGRSFSRFETRFQVYWVIGAIVPVVLETPAALGFFAIAVAATVAAVTYFLGSRNSGESRPLRAGAAPHEPLDDLGDDLDSDELRPSYPSMDLRMPVRMPTGWIDRPRSGSGPPGGPGRPAGPPLRRPGDEPARPDPTPSRADRTSADPPDQDEQLPLWDD